MYVYVIYIVVICDREITQQAIQYAETSFQHS